MELSVIGIQYHKWKDIKWQGRIMPIEIDYSRIPKYKHRHAVKVYNKELGLLPEDKDKLPIGCKVFAILTNRQNHVKATVIDKPKNWKIPFSSRSSKKFSPDFLSKVGNECQEIDNFQERTSPIRFHEWLIRTQTDEEDVDADTIYSYFHFREWLDDSFRRYRRRYSSKYLRRYSEKNYGSLEFEEYVEYCRKESEFTMMEVMTEKILRGDRLKEARSQFLGAEQVDDDDAVFDDEGNWLGML